MLCNIKNYVDMFILPSVCVRVCVRAGVRACERAGGSVVGTLTVD